MRFPSKEIVESIRKQYPKGTRVRLVRMQDTYSKLEVGDEGSVISVDDIGTIHVSWDKGGSLGVAFGEDLCEKTEL